MRRLTGIAVLLTWSLVVAFAGGLDHSTPKSGVVKTAISPTIISTGDDQTADLQALFNGASSGDTLSLIPQNGRAFVFSGTLNWTGTNSVNVNAVGATLQGSGTGATLIFGAPTGQRGGGVEWRGGTVRNAAFVLSNVSYSNISPMGLGGGLTIHADTVCSYLCFQVPGSINGGAGPAITIDQVGSGWCNMIRFMDTPFVAGSGQALIHQTNKSPIYYPGLWKFDHCDFESAGPIYDCGLIQQHLYEVCWFEPAGQFSLGNLDPASRITFRDGPKGLPFYLDPRVIQEGNQQ